MIEKNKMASSSKRKTQSVDARSVVLKLLRSTRQLPTRRFASAADRDGLVGRDRALARELLSGVLRHQRSLDALYMPLVRRQSIDPLVRWVLRLAVYQLFYLDRIPPHAAIDATLNAGREMLRHAVGFANGVLRNVERATGGDYAGYMRKCFDECSDDLNERLAIEFSYPTELVSAWINEVGEEVAIARMKVFNKTPPLTLRANRLQSSREEVVAAFTEAKIEVETISDNALLLKRARINPTELPGYAEGWWSVQDLTSQETIALAAPAAGERILDYCSAPGGKAFAALEIADGKAEVVACDNDQNRLEKIPPEAARLRHELKTIVSGDDGSGVPDGEWDLIMLDVPCSNTGVLGRRAEARWRYCADFIDGLLNQQKLIIELAAKHRGEKTRVLYSTCSLEPEENSAMAAYAANLMGLTIAEERKFEPDETRSGGYAALLIP